MAGYSIKVSEADFVHATADLDRLRTSLEGYCRDLERGYASMETDWQGTAGAAFAQHVPKILERYGQLTDKMEQITESIRRTGTTMGQQDAALARASTVE
ncbi:MAG: WXG100 family type VII secretion target [Clostridiales Family XIII bacterium]|jgi:WXG100 family type VII secretion target|nr:WXG100 family type VII secretion target [Clostridiales Family XIII bacterium]